MRLDRFVRIHFPGLPFGLLSSALKRGRLTVDGRRAKATDRLAAGALVAIEGAAPAAPAAALPVDAAAAAADRAFLESILVHADDDLLVFDKPAGLAVHAGTKVTRHLEGCLAAWADPGGERPHLVHRLDKDTSGLIVAARRRAVAGALGRALAAGDVDKEYRAVVTGTPPAESGRIDRALRKIATPAGARVTVADGDPEADRAVTRWRVLARAADGGRALMALNPETGRQHQLRVHMAALGVPILGDRLYAPAEPSAGVRRLHLHAFRLAFRHPRGGEVALEAPLPAGFAEAVGPTT